MIGLMPAEVASVSMGDRKERIYRVRIPGLTDGCTEFPQAELCNPIGDKSEHTEISIKPGDRVWLAFQHGDPRYPVIVGFRPRNKENAIDWRRFEHANFEFLADNTFRIIAPGQAHIVTTLALLEADDVHCTKNLTVDGAITANGGIQVNAGEGEGPAMKVNGGAEFSKEVFVKGIPSSTHGHIARGEGQRVGNPVE
ncbi:phage baseplate assembly protein V [Burkholderia arboris]|uniref:phage baseplate assembly protein V n=1 Tax=Burkholderia arboris TaxID=488730 RepID=UPI001CF4066C|nr:phage baseplate assembly protein V [Burkholderia arboris]MCA8037131.1 phage baseplate assembly protein V [Burkholderia arboris]